MKRPVVRPATTDDLSAIVSWHLTEFPRGFFARLGPKFLSVYYRTYLGAPHARLLVASNASGRVAYVAAMLNARGHRHETLRRHRLELLIAGVAALLRRPGLAVHFLRSRALRYARKVLLPAAGTGERTALVAGTVDHIAVAPHARGRGVARLLLDTVVQDARDSGADMLMLVAENLPELRAFYTRCGWRWTGETRDVDGRVLQRWVLPVDGGDPEPGATTGARGDGDAEPRGATGSEP